MGKRTSDFVALAVIVGGAGLGLGLTSLFARSRAAPVPDARHSSVDVQVLRRSIVVEPTWTARASGERRIVHEALIVEPERIEVEYSVAPSFRFRTRVRTNAPDREPLERLMAQLGELELEGSELDELKERLSEALKGVEVLEDLDLEENFTIDILRSDDDDDERRRRRRRPR